MQQRKPVRTQAGGFNSLEAGNRNVSVIDDDGVSGANLPKVCAELVLQVGYTGFFHLAIIAILTSVCHTLGGGAPSNLRVGKLRPLLSNSAALDRRKPTVGMESTDMRISYYRWIIVAAGGLLGCVAIGAMFALPVFLRPIALATGWSVTGISSAMTFGFRAMALGSVVWGNLSDRFGPRVTVLIGSSVLATALALASRATSLIEFQLIFGLLVGGATAAIFAPMMACVTGWFDTRRSLAVSLQLSRRNSSRCC